MARVSPRLSLCLLVTLVVIACQGLEPAKGEAPPRPVDPAARERLEASWRAYRTRFIQDDGRVIDRKASSISTSEGQAYALLRALWLDDRDTFTRVLRWTKDNLNVSCRKDNLYGWKWGRRGDGSWGILDPNAASDADQLVAYALIGAHRRWGEQAWLDQARALLADIWRLETGLVHGRRVLLPGDWVQLPGNGRLASGPSEDGQKSGSRARHFWQRSASRAESGAQSTAGGAEGEGGIPLVVPLNPSYYLPFAYRTFHQVDPRRGWLELLEGTWSILEQCRSPLGLPVDWCRLEASSGKTVPGADLSDRSGDFGYEAFRVLWNLSADLRWNDEAKARQLIQQADWLRRYFAVRGQLPAILTVDGIPRETYESMSLYGAFLPALSVLDASLVPRLEKKLADASRDGFWGDPEDYYIQNWVWFGLALEALPSPMPPAP